MKKLNLINLFLVATIAFTLSGCDLVVDIFEAGAWTAIIGIILVAALVVWLIRKMAK